MTMIRWDLRILMDNEHKRLTQVIPYNHFMSLAQQRIADKTVVRPVPL